MKISSDLEQELEALKAAGFNVTSEEKKHETVLVNTYPKGPFTPLSSTQAPLKLNGLTSETLIITVSYPGVSGSVNFSVTPKGLITTAYTHTMTGDELAKFEKKFPGSNNSNSKPNTLADALSKVAAVDAIIHRPSM